MNSVRVAGHCGEWLQGRLGPSGPVVLVTLPCNALGVRGWQRDAAGLRLSGAGISMLRAQHFLRRLGLGMRGRVLLRASAPPGLGAGMSTAQLVALARLAGWQGDPLALARACVACEGASDPLMFPAPERMLWASRAGRIVQPMPALPQHDVLAGFLGGPVPTDPHDNDFADISDLVDDWSRAQTLPAFAAMASESAARCLRHRGPADDATARLARDSGALGWAIAHTGAARALIFAPGQIPADAPATMRRAGFRSVMRFRGGGRP
ncbi:MAG: propanediol utilization protein [Rhodobacteraceae bacterium]|nr:propanediol utilization protein [Paracoccaceae bacterium]